jgi:hypothetical protein
VIRDLRLGWVVAASMSMANWANADELHSGMYELSTVPGNQLDYRKVYLVVEKHDVQGF